MARESLHGAQSNFRACARLICPFPSGAACARFARAVRVDWTRVSRQEVREASCRPLFVCCNAMQCRVRDRTLSRWPELDVRVGLFQMPVRLCQHPPLGQRSSHEMPAECLHWTRVTATATGSSLVARSSSCPAERVLVSVRLQHWCGGRGTIAPRIYSYLVDYATAPPPRRANRSS